MATFLDLPDHILSQILYNLPPKSRPKIKYVNRRLYSIVSRNPRLKYSISDDLEIRKFKAENGQIWYGISSLGQNILLTPDSVRIGKGPLSPYEDSDEGSEENLVESAEDRSFWYCAGIAFGIDNMEFMKPYPIQSKELALQRALSVFLDRCNFATFILMNKQGTPDFTEAELKWICAETILMAKVHMSRFNEITVATDKLLPEHRNLIKQLGCYRMQFFCNNCFFRQRLFLFQRMGLCWCTTPQPGHEELAKNIFRMHGLLEEIIFGRKDLVKPKDIVQMLKEWRCGTRSIVEIKYLSSTEVAWPDLLSSFQQTALKTWQEPRGVRNAFDLVREADGQVLTVEYYQELRNVHLLAIRQWDRLRASRRDWQWTTGRGDAEEEDDDIPFPLELFVE